MWNVLALYGKNVRGPATAAQYDSCVCVVFVHWHQQLPKGTGAPTSCSLRIYTNLAISVYTSPVGSGGLVVDTTHFHVPATDSVV